MSSDPFFLALNHFFRQTNIEDASHFVHTLEQNRLHIQPVLEDANKYWVNFDYLPDTTGGYTSGKVLVHYRAKNPLTEDPPHYYSLELFHEGRLWSYCQCKPTDVGYVETRECCGEGCDWYAPTIELLKIETMTRFSFQGIARTLWQVEEDWHTQSNMHPKDNQ